jgi:hypothetical protein
MQVLCFAPRDVMSVTARGLHEMNTPVITVLVGVLLRLGMACHVGQCRSRPAGEYGAPGVSRPRLRFRSFVCSSLTRQAWRMVALLIVSVAVAGLVGYQFHTVAHDPMQASPAMHEGACAFHMTSHLCSLIATLPKGLAFALLALFTPVYSCLGLSSPRVRFSSVHPS